ncbi:MAG: acyltransferase [Deltaproteobacteria bacterium]|nr:acyltransferase [Deltaproteobacteria bacterium]
MSEESRLVLFEHSRIGPGFYFSIGHKATVSIGSWTYIGSDFDIHCRSTVQIGSRCMISHGVRMIDYDGHRISYAGKENSDIFVSGFNVGGCAPITIEDEVWIGMGVTILKGVRIARGAVVSAGSTVCSDVPTGCLVAGNPARVVKEEVSWSHF